MQGSLWTEVVRATEQPGYTNWQYEWRKVWGPAGSLIRLVHIESGEVVHERSAT